MFIEKKIRHTIATGKSHRKYRCCGISCDYSYYVHNKYYVQHMLDKIMNSSLPGFRHIPNYNNVCCMKE